MVCVKHIFSDDSIFHSNLSRKNLKKSQISTIYFIQGLAMGKIVFQMEYLNESMEWLEEVWILWASLSKAYIAMLLQLMAVLILQFQGTIDNLLQRRYNSMMKEIFTSN